MMYEPEKSDLGIVAMKSTNKAAERFLAAMRERLSRFGLELHPEKTRLLAFGKYARSYRRQQGQRKAETFNFLGFTHISSVDRHGRFQLHATRAGIGCMRRCKR